MTQTILKAFRRLNIPPSALVRLFKKRQRRGDNRRDNMSKREFQRKKDKRRKDERRRERLHVQISPEFLTMSRVLKDTLEQLTNYCVHVYA